MSVRGLFGKRTLLPVVVVFASLVMAASASAAVQITIGLSSQSSDSLRVLEQVLVPEFEAAHPNIEVEFVPVPWNERETKLATMYAGGLFPDIYEIGSNQVLSDLKNGYPTPLDRYIASWRSRDDFFPEAWRSSSWENRQYGVPFTLNGRHLFYFTSVFEEVGLDAETPPDGWDELLEYTRKLLVTDSEGRVIRLGLDLEWPQPQAMFWFWMQNGVEIADETTGRALFNTPEGREATAFWLETWTMQNPTRPLPNFWARNVGIKYLPSSQGPLFTIQRAPELLKELRLFIPTRNGTKVWPLYINSLAIGSQSKYPDEAWTFIDWFIQPENSTRYFEGITIPSPNLKSLDTDFMQSDKMRPLHQMYMEAQYARRDFFPPHNQTNGIIRDGQVRNVVLA